MFDTYLGAWATLLCGAVVVTLAALAARAINRRIIARERRQGERRRHELLGESLLKACRGDLIRAYAAVERARMDAIGRNVMENNGLYKRMRNEMPEQRAARDEGLLNLYHQLPNLPPLKVERVWQRPQPQVDRAGSLRVVADGKPLRFVDDWVPAGADWRQR